MKKIFFCLCLSLAFYACKKEQQSFCVDAIVKWGGAPELDGLGWYLILNNDSTIAYTPANLPDNFKVNGLAVNACMFETDKKFYCMCAQPMAVYQITSIQKR
jgi:hypothetical protein